MKNARTPKMKNERPTKRNSNGRSTTRLAQIKRLYKALRLRPHHTYELRKMGISHPAGRVQDLEEDGYVISSDRINTVDSDGFLHTGVALYSIVSEPERQASSDDS